MGFVDLFKPIEDTPVAAFVRENPYAFPVLEGIHVAAVMLVVGSIAMLDLRLIGVSSRNFTVTKLTAEVLPWTWVSFGIAAVSGALLLTGQAGAYASNLQFQMKMGLMALAGLNMLVFHLLTWRTVHDWNGAIPTPAMARIAGLLSLALWIGVVICGRWVGWTVSSSPF